MLDDNSAGSSGAGGPVTEVDKVGYCSPPKHTRFKKGQSGNPRGRLPERDHVLSMEECFNDNLAKEMVITDNGKRETITIADALTRRVLTDAINGNTSAVRNALQYMREFKVGRRPAKPPEDHKSITVRFVGGPPGSLSEEQTSEPEPPERGHAKD